MSRARDDKILVDAPADVVHKITRVDLLYHQHNVRAEKLKVRTKIVEKERYKECTFQPNLTKTDEFNKRRSTRSTTAKAKPEEVVGRLYATQKEKYSMLEQIKSDIKLKKDLEELQNCTFKPKINEIDRIEDLKNMYEKTQLPVHYIKTIERLRTANEKHVELKKKLEHIPKGENYERRKTEKVVPPSCANPDRKARQRIPIIHFDVNIGPGRVGRVAIFEGDDPAEKARSFAAAFQLKPEVEENLRHLIEVNLEEYLSK